jgi:hypothetical protein
MDKLVRRDAGTGAERPNELTLFGGLRRKKETLLLGHGEALGALDGVGVARLVRQFGGAARQKQTARDADKNQL